MPAFFCMPCNSIYRATQLQALPQPKGEVKGNSSSDCVECMKDNWRLAPVFVIVAALIIALAAALIWREPYLTIPSGAALLCTFFLIYIVYNYKHLKDFGESNKQYKLQIARHEAANTALEGRVTELVGVTDGLRTENGRYEQLNSQLQGRLKTFEDQCKGLNEVLGGLNRHGELSGEQLIKQQALQRDLDTIIGKIGGEQSSLSEGLRALHTLVSQSQADSHAMQAIQAGTVEQANEIRAGMEKSREIVTLLADITPKIAALAAANPADTLNAMAKLQKMADDAVEKANQANARTRVAEESERNLQKLHEQEVQQHKERMEELSARHREIEEAWKEQYQKMQEGVEKINQAGSDLSSSVEDLRTLTPHVRAQSQAALDPQSTRASFQHPGNFGDSHKVVVVG